MISVKERVYIDMSQVDKIVDLKCGGKKELLGKLMGRKAKSAYHDIKRVGHIPKYEVELLKERTGIDITNNARVIAPVNPKDIKKTVNVDVTNKTGKKQSIIVDPDKVDKIVKEYLDGHHRELGPAIGRSRNFYYDIMHRGYMGKTEYLLINQIYGIDVELKEEEPKEEASEKMFTLDEVIDLVDGIMSTVMDIYVCNASSFYVQERGHDGIMFREVNAISSKKMAELLENLNETYLEKLKEEK